MEDLLQDAQLSCGGAGLGLLRGRKIWQSQKRTAVHGQGPLDGTQEEHLTPSLFKENHLRTSQKHMSSVSYMIFCMMKLIQ